jgi:hypothetical protein
MPWKPEQAKKHNKAATGKKAKQWAATADEVLKQTGDDAKAIRIANAAIKKGKTK